MAKTIDSLRRLSRCAVLAATALASLVGTGCTVVGVDYVPPEYDGPAGYHAELNNGLNSKTEDIATWWQSFNDPALSMLVDRALAENFDLQAGNHRILEFAAIVNTLVPNLYPTIDLEASYARNRVSQQNVFAIPNRNSNQFTLGVAATWELDLWGRIRRNIEAAEADFGVAMEDYSDLNVSLVAEVVSAYVDFQIAQERTLILRTNVDLQQNTLKIAQSRFDSGLVGELDVAQAASILETTRSVLPDAVAAKEIARNRIAALLGTYPGEISEVLEATAIPTPPKEIAVGVPADAVRRRPDVRAMERRLAAATARIGVAEGDLYPRISILGSIGLEADDAASLFQNRADAFGFGPSITWNLFDRSRIYANINAAEERQKQALSLYKGTVVAAVQEVENAIVSYVQIHERMAALIRAVERARKALELSREQYRQGLVSFQSVIDTQQRRLELEDSLVTTRGEAVLSAISIFRSIGGGWQLEPEAPAETEEEESK